MYVVPCASIVDSVVVQKYNSQLLQEHPILNKRCVLLHVETILTVVMLHTARLHPEPKSKSEEF